MKNIKSDYHNYRDYFFDCYSKVILKPISNSENRFDHLAHFLNLQGKQIFKNKKSSEFTVDFTKLLKRNRL